ncbi:hypothetical protein X801_00112 [Opisthorchis viverrini]|uniref:Uncharacterized protein n=2 Tax=Opisthorchis viverrini TaxID=6198 RepID=A0A074ZVB4_OPIVI|nr:hypothetical protein T265_02638 [Opisthorchis viverrini]KER31076.1 hypothetical protein T265_02638 [Opisthorchis viverrini]OON23973.1 hypothetical protein X801_00112 [Opisthorchis viverrini]
MQPTRWPKANGKLMWVTGTLDPDNLKSLNPDVWSDGTFTDCSVGAVTGEIIRYTVTLEDEKLKPEYQDLDVELLTWYVSKLLSGSENGCETTAELQLTGVYETDFCDNVMDKELKNFSVRGCKEEKVHEQKVDGTTLVTYIVTISSFASNEKAYELLEELQDDLKFCKYNGHSLGYTA